MVAMIEWIPMSAPIGDDMNMDERLVLVTCELENPGWWGSSRRDSFAVVAGIFALWPTRVLIRDAIYLAENGYRSHGWVLRAWAHLPEPYRGGEPAADSEPSEPLPVRHIRRGS